MFQHPVNDSSSKKIFKFSTAKQKPETQITKRQSKKKGRMLLDFTQEITENDPAMLKYFFRNLYEENKEVAAEVLSEKISDANSVSGEEGNYQRSKNNQTIKGYKTMKKNNKELRQRQAKKGKIIIDFYPPTNQVLECKEKNVDHVKEEDYEIGKKPLEKTHQGKNKDKTEMLAVCRRKDLLDNIEKVVSKEENEIVFENTHEPLVVVLTGDSGGQRDVDSFTILNKEDEEKVKLHPICVTEGSDSIQNKKVALRPLLTQIKKLNGSKTVVHGKNRKIKFMTVLDMKGEDAYVNKQGSTSTMPDTYTNVTLKHLSSEEHAGKPHSEGDCKLEMSFRSMDDYRNDLNDAIMENDGLSTNLKKVSKKHGNLVGGVLVELEDLDDYHFAPFHGINGISVRFLKIQRKELRNLDEERCFSEESQSYKKETLIKIEDEIEKNEIHIDDIDHEIESLERAQFLLRNSKKRHEAQLQGDFELSLTIANDYYKEFKENRTEAIENCNSINCISKMFDKEADEISKIKCFDCKELLCIRDEGILETFDNIENYCCLKCRKFPKEKLTTFFQSKINTL